MNTDFMSQTEKDVLTLIGYAYKGEKMPKGMAKDYNWREIFDELLKQAMISVPIDIVNEEELPSELFEEWIEYSVNTILQHEMIGIAQDELIELADANGIAIAILKGLAAAKDYPNPLYRALGDIDFLVKRADFDKMLKIMSESGYALTHPIDHTEYHVTLQKGEVIYELHREPAGIGHNAKSEYIRARLESAMDRIERAQENGHEIRLLPEEEHSLVLMLHLVKHLDEGIGLRQLCDWLSCAEANISDEAWSEKYSSVYEAAGLGSMAKAVTKLGKLYFGTGQSIHWCDEADARICERLMEFAVQNGNFGMKDDTARSSMKFTDKTREQGSGSTASIFKKLQKIGEREWKALAKHERLRPFAWLYAIFRYIYLVLSGKRDMGYLKKLKKTINTKQELQNALEIFK